MQIIMAHGIQWGFEAEKEDAFVFPVWQKKSQYFLKERRLTDGGDVEEEEEDHADRVVDGGEEGADDALGDGVDELHGELEEDRPGRIRDGAGQDRGEVQLHCRLK